MRVNYKQQQVDDFFLCMLSSLGRYQRAQESPASYKAPRFPRSSAFTSCVNALSINWGLGVKPFLIQLKGINKRGISLVQVSASRNFIEQTWANSSPEDNGNPGKGTRLFGPIITYSLSCSFLTPHPGFCTQQTWHATTGNVALSLNRTPSLSDIVYAVESCKQISGVATP